MGAVRVAARSDESVAERYAYVDGLRALAVLAVVIVHGFDGAASAANLQTGFPANLGDRGVDLFFVISGFCLARPFLASAIEKGSLDINFGGFMIRRFARIAPPFYGALAIFTILSFTPFGYPTAFGPGQVVAGLRELPFDVLFLTGHGPFANPSFWTLGLEMRWYVLCPLLIALFVRSRIAFVCLAVACWSAYAHFNVIPGDVGLLPCFMIGIVAAAIDLSNYARRISIAASFVALPVFTIAALGQSRLSYIEHGDPWWHIACGLLVIGSGSALLKAILSWRPLVAVGRASYSIYLIHMPFAFWLGHLGVPWTLSSFVGVLLGFAFWFIVERYFLRSAVRKRIEAKLASVGRFYPRPPLVLSVATSSGHI